MSTQQRWLKAVVAGVLLAGLSASVAPAGTTTGANPGVLVMAIGGDASWNQMVQEAVAPLRQKYPIEIAFGVAQRSAIQKAVDRLESQGARHIAVVRMFISGDSFLERTRYVLGLEEPPARVPNQHSPHADGHDSAHEEHGHEHGGGHAPGPPLPIETKCRFYLSKEGLAESPLLDEILVDRVRALSIAPAQESVLLVAHGPAEEAENERWLANMHLRAQSIHRLGPFRHVECATLREDWPSRRRYAEQHIRRYVEDATGDGGRVIVVPFRLAEAGPYEEVLDGLDYVAARQGFLPHANITRWIEQTANACLAVAPDGEQTD